MSSTVYILCIVAVSLTALLIVAYYEEKHAKEAEAQVKATKDQIRADRFEALRQLKCTKQEIQKTRRNLHIVKDDK